MATKIQLECTYRVMGCISVYVVISNEATDYLVHLHVGVYTPGNDDEKLRTDLFIMLRTAFAVAERDIDRGIVDLRHVYRAQLERAADLKGQPAVYTF